jgi:hypothetical protein
LLIFTLTAIRYDPPFFPLLSVPFPFPAVDSAMYDNGNLLLTVLGTAKPNMEALTDLISNE